MHKFVIYLFSLCIIASPALAGMAMLENDQLVLTQIKQDEHAGHANMLATDCHGEHCQMQQDSPTNCKDELSCKQLHCLSLAILTSTQLPISLALSSHQVATVSGMLLQQHQDFIRPPIA